ncbi:MAG: bifunctional metallophosphatase/5'-nucleotidase [Bacteriovoracia bacterium]
MKFISSIMFSLLITTPAFAELIQILHTNDLHSHLEHATQRPDLGGYARLKALMDHQRLEAKRKGIGTISMDAGDFMEGSIFYLADKGRKTFEAFDKLRHDVAILGNHDYLMAPADLDAILRDVPPHRPLLAANFKIDSSYTHIREHVKPVWEGVVSGVKVGVIGLTTNDLLYKWRLKGDGGISSEVKTAKKWAGYLRERGNEVIIALTHIGISKDKNLAKEVPEIDVIVGGHSHSELQQVVWQKTKQDKKIKMVPIVQAGHHGEWLGKLIFDYDRNMQTVKVVEYNLLPVNGDSKDPEMLSLVAEANRDLHDEYGQDWLNEIVGLSTLRPNYVEGDEKVWHYFLNDAMMEATDADFAIHAPALSGNNYPVGTVTRRDLYEGNPRTFDFKDKFGYNVYTARIMGGWIKMIAAVTMKLNIPLYFAGIEFKWKKKPNGKVSIWDVTHNGRRINPFKYYKVAFSEGIVRGAYGISPLTRFIVHEGEREKVPMWQALEDKFKRDGKITPDYLDGYFDKRGPASVGKMGRMMVPAQ